jgi:myo-inositol-1(or 4)-monophosphatase
VVAGGFLEVAVRAARRAQEVILGNLGKLSRSDVGRKQSSDFVTGVDRDSEKAIIETIREAFPDHLFIAEESASEAPEGKHRWIIDPLDGTTNYIHQYPVFSVSIALEHEGELVLGVVLDPVREELYTAEKGRGAFLNGKPVRVSGVSSFSDALIATGFPFRQKDRTDLYLSAFKNVFLRTSGLRRAGSAAIDLAYVASGRCDGFFELGLAPWDVAAGDVIIREAGGVVTDFGGGKGHVWTGNIVAANPSLHQELLGEIRKVFTGIIDR